MFSERIKELRKERKLTQKQFADLMYVDQTTVSCWETGKASPDTEKLSRIADILSVSMDELFGQKAVSKSKGVKIPVLGRVQAGIPIDAIEEILDYEEITDAMARQGEHFGLVVRGDSMFPKIVEDDVVIVRKQDDCDNGDIAVVLVNGNEATVKKIKKTPAGVTLIPLNPAYEMINYSTAEIESLPVRVVGKVVELRRKF